MRIVSRKKLRAFWEQRTNAQKTLETWLEDVKKATWKTPNDIKNVYRNASVVANNRVLISKGMITVWLWLLITTVALFTSALLVVIANMTK